MTATNLLFRCHRAGSLMTEPRTKSELLSVTTKDYLAQLFIQEKYGRNRELVNKYVNKGLQVEEDSLTLYSVYKGQYFQKNEEQYSNEYLKGTPDIVTDDLVIDIKSSWDIFTFFKVRESLNKTYYWQLQAYLDLTGKDKAILAYCLTDTPVMMIEDEKRKLAWKMGVIDPDANEEYQLACNQIESLGIYNDIPDNERVIEIEIERNQKDIDLLHQRIEQCREYMNKELFKINAEKAIITRDAEGASRTRRVKRVPVTDGEGGI